MFKLPQMLPGRLPRVVPSFSRLAVPITVHCIHPISMGFRNQTVRLSRERVRPYATPAPHVHQSNLSVEAYHAHADLTMEKLLDSLENLLDSLGHADCEVEYSSGVLTLKLGEKGTYVINKQPPNKQIWLSSPLSGPKRYDYVPQRDSWIYSRDSRSLGDLLNQELSETLGCDIDVGLGELSQ